MKAAITSFSRLEFHLFYRFWDCVILSLGLPTWQLFLSHVEMPSLGRIYACSKSHTASTIRIHQPPIPSSSLFGYASEERSCSPQKQHAQLTAASISLLRKTRLKKRNPMKTRYLNPYQMSRMKRRTSACTYRFHRKKGRSVLYPRQRQRLAAQIYFRIYYT